MPIQIQDIHDQEESMDCPLCLEALEVDDINFFPCECGYQICRFCWHRIRTDENGLCPACRKSYPENPVEFKPLSGQELQKIRLEKKQKEVARKQKITEGRKHLANVRVLQKNLVFVVGLSQRLADVEILKRQEYFGKYGKIIKVVLNSNTSYVGSQTPSCSAYVTYSKMEEALRAIQSVNNVHIDGRTLKASLGTTKYCSNYLKNQQCMKHDCMYLHELGEDEASFTKEDMQGGKHQEYEQKLIQQMIHKEIAAVQQEMKTKSQRLDIDGDNDPGSTGSSPPMISGAITEGLSVAQAVKKNTKTNVANSGRLRRHSGSSTQTSTAISVVEVSGNKAGDNSISKTEKGRNVARRGNIKKPLNPTNSVQAPRHKKQQQQQQQFNGTKKVPSRPHSVSPSAQNSHSVSGSGSEQSPSSLPVSAETSVESSPAVTPLREVTMEGNKNSVNQMFKQTLPDIISSTTSHKISLHFLQESGSLRFSPNDINEPDRTGTLPIDIPILSTQDTYRDEKFADISYTNAGNRTSQATEINHGINSNNALAQSRFMLLHKGMQDGQSSLFTQNVSNSAGYLPFGSTLNIAPSLHQNFPPSDGRTSNLSNTPLLPPGLGGFPVSNSGWPTAGDKLSDTMPIKNDLNDWEAAFGFKSSELETTPGDDDLGFDPFAECSKGLADLMEKELSTRDNQSNFSKQATTNTSTNFSNASHLTHSPSSYPDIAASTRPMTLPDRFRADRSPQQFHMNDGRTNLSNGYTHIPLNLMLNRGGDKMEMQKMPFPFENQHAAERSLFLQNQRLNQMVCPEHSYGEIQNSENMNSPVSAGNQTIMGKDMPINKTNLQEWQNGLRALLPSVNINFAIGNDGNGRSQPLGMPESSLGLSGLGMPRQQLSKMPGGMQHPPGLGNFMSHQSIQPHKHHIPLSAGVRFEGQSPFLASRQWSVPESSMSNPSMPTGRLTSPSGLHQSVFGMRSESNPMPETGPSFPQDPAIISSGNHPLITGGRRPRLFENRTSNGSEEQPHWMKSLQTLTELESPINPAAHSTFGSLFSQQRHTNVPSWPSAGNLYSTPGFGPSQPPPGFQTKPSLPKATEFGMPHNLLENQS